MAKKARTEIHDYDLNSGYIVFENDAELTIDMDDFKDFVKSQLDVTDYQTKEVDYETSKIGRITHWDDVWADHSASEYLAKFLTRRGLWPK